MRIQLYNPPVHHYAGVHYRMNPPLGLPILAAVLERNGHQATVWDLEAMLISPEKLAASYQRDPGEWPDAVGFTVTSHGARGARECVAALRKIGYRGQIVLGGPHITMLGRGPIDELGAWGADTWVVGECEGNIAQVYGQGLRGLVEGERAPIETIPGPLWGAHTPQPTSYYGNLPDVGKPEGIAMWSRGCPHNCIFCGNPVFGHQRVRRRPAEAIYEDMAALKALGARSVFVYDDELPGMPGGDDWLIEVCERIAPLGLTWKCQGRCTTKTRPEVLEAMYRAGCRAVMWGVESFDPTVLAQMRKGITPDDIWHTLRASRDAGIGNWIFLMVGNYGEGPAELATTAAALGRAKREGLVQWRQVTVTTPVPGTELYRRGKEEGWLREPPEGGPQMAQVYQDTPWLKAREIRYWKARLESI